MSRRLVIGIAILAALLGAPSRAFAAGNELTAAQVTPTSGSTAVTFTLSVTYAGRSPATAVSAQLAGTTVSLALVSGTPEAGVWAAATRLPAGTWSVTFTAASVQGNQPILVGPTVVVEAVTPPPPTSSSTTVPIAAPSSRDTTDAGSAPPDSGGTVPAPAPVEAPAASAAPSAIASTDAAPIPMAPTPSTATPSTERQAPSAPHAPAGAPASAPTSGGIPFSGGAPTSGDAIPIASSAPDAAPLFDVVATPSASAAGAASATGETPNASALALVIGLSGTAAVALIGSGLLLAARRRAGRREPSQRAGSRAELPPIAVRSSDPDTVPEHRTLHRPRVPLSDDPIVAAMGLGTEQEEERRRRRRERDTTAGPPRP